MDDTEHIVNFLKRNRLMLTSAESCTAGLVPALLTDIPGSGAVFEMGFITYSPRAKSQLLGVKPITISKYGLTSEEVAREMALGALTRSGADIAVAITGTADEGGKEDQAGKICLAFAIKANSVNYLVSETKIFNGNRRCIKESAAQYALKSIPDILYRIKSPAELS